MARVRLFSIGVLVALLVSACAPAETSPGGRTDSSRNVAGPLQSAAPKRLLGAVPMNPVAFYEKVARAVVSGPYRGGVDLEWLLNSGLTVVDNTGSLRGQLADEAPTILNGLWKVFPDGRMETTWHIRQGTQWHDGTPFTSDDLVFTASVFRDKEVAGLRDPAIDRIESVEAPDPTTVVVRWKSPVITADQLFGHVLATPMPKHILESVYSSDRDNFLQAPYWLSEFVGTGPFKLSEFSEGSHFIMTANERYSLGRPKIDAIEVRIITDPGTTMSNVLAGTVELTLGYGVSFESAMELRERWKDGTVQVAPDAWVMGFAQHIDPNPAALADIRFKRALFFALNRQEMAESLLAGQSQVTHVFLNPAEPDYKEVAASIVAYNYEPRRAQQLIEEAGLTRGQDGFFRDPSGQRPSIEIRTSEGLDIQVKATFAIADAWKRLGIATEPLVRAPGRQDREWSATFPGYRVQRSPNDFELMKRFTNAEVPTAANGWVGRNSPRYASQSLSDAIERYFVTVPKPERNQILGQILHEMTDQLVLMGMFYNVLAVITGKRVHNVTPSNVMGSNQTWNAHLWELIE